jgi:iron(III) transport system permease protein
MHQASRSLLHAYRAELLIYSADDHYAATSRKYLGGDIRVLDVMKELPATLMLRPFDTDTLAVMAYQLARDERLAEAALPSLALVLVGLVPVMLLSRSLRQRLP